MKLNCSLYKSFHLKSGQRDASVGRMAVLGGRRERQFEHAVRNVSEDGTNEASEAIHEALLLLLRSDF